jgi:IstB-like ATP binding protein
MLANHRHERLIALRLIGMAKAFDDQLRQPDADTLAFGQRLGLMIDREVTERENRRLVTRVKLASLRQTAVIEDIDLRTSRGIDRAFLAKLVDGGWIAGPARVGSLARSATRPAVTIVPSSIIAFQGCSRPSRRLKEWEQLRGKGDPKELAKAMIEHNKKLKEKRDAALRDSSHEKQSNGRKGK